VRQAYTKEELGAATIRTGMDAETTMGHVNSNFVNQPTGIQDIFNMEGAPNEHFTSSGAADCHTRVGDCTGELGHRRCKTFTARTCQLPNREKFDEMFSAADVNKDGIMTAAEAEAPALTAGILPPDTNRRLSEGVMRYPLVDRNPIGEGQLPGVLVLMIQLFGETKTSISKENLEAVFIDRKFPTGFTVAGASRPTVMPSTGATPLGGGPVVEASLANINSIICPFLSTLVNEGVLPVRQAYTKEELGAATMQTGLSAEITMPHVNSNFVNQPTGIQDIFNMEGAPNEHFTSTGITDCKTTFEDCQGELGTRSCQTFTARTCKIPNFERFEEMFSAADVNKDGFMTREEANAPFLTAGILPPDTNRRLEGEERQLQALRYPEVDSNPIGEGNLPGVLGLMMTIFGETKDMISKDRLAAVFLTRKFPVGFTLPGATPPHAMASMPADLNSAVVGSSSVATPLGEGPVVEASLANTNSIICPFLSTLINEGVLPVRQAYTKEELGAATIRTGMDAETTMGHVNSNFVNQPTGIQDIFNMEGAPNEHFTSSGAADCHTRVGDCTGELGHRRCKTFTARTCQLPNREKFDEMFSAADVNKDGIMTAAEAEAPALTAGILPPDTNRRLSEGVMRYPLVDRNPIGEGQLPGVLVLMIQLFGETKTSISKENLEAVFIDRKFPTGFTVAGASRPTVMPSTGATPLGGGPVVEASLANINSIICPFLSTLVNEGVLPVRQAYTKEELGAATMQTGLSAEITMPHVNSNFVNQPTGIQDIFNMEGAPNEHFTSTGITDCKTTFEDCQGELGTRSCQTFTARTCKIPNFERFEEMFSAADVNKDGFMTREEANAPFLTAGILPPDTNRRLEGEERQLQALRYPEVDSNPIGEGNLPGVLGLMMTIFGETKDMISKDRLAAVFLTRKFPVGFTLPGATPPHAMASMPADLNSAVVSSGSVLAIGLPDLSTWEAWGLFACASLLVLPYIKRKLSMSMRSPMALSPDTEPMVIETRTDE